MTNPEELDRLEGKLTDICDTFQRYDYILGEVGDVIKELRAEIVQLRLYAERYRWCLSNPGEAILYFSEATNPDTFGLKIDAEISRRYLKHRIDDAMNANPAQVDATQRTAIDGDAGSMPEPASGKAPEGNEMIRVRFKVNVEDYRPVNWPIKHPYWCGGFGDDYSILISYADDESYIVENWPEATDIESQEVDGYIFTDRFPKPDWFHPEGE